MVTTLVVVSAITLPLTDDFRLITSKKRHHQKSMDEIHDINKSINLILKHAKCKSICIQTGKSDVSTFSIGDNVFKSFKDDPEKFVGSNIAFSGKSSYIDVIKTSQREKNRKRFVINDQR